MVVVETEDGSDDADEGAFLFFVSQDPDWTPPSSIDEGGDGERVVREGESPVAALQVRSPLEGAGRPKKVRATWRGITTRRLAAHRRLIATISEFERPELFSALVGAVGDVVIASTADDDDNNTVGPDDNAPSR